LHYVDRSNPLGDTPKDPNSDPYYEPWEIGIKNWILKKEQDTGKKITQSSPPTEYDDVHVPSNFPTVSVQNPSENQTIGRQFEIETFASAPRKISRVEFYIDGAYLGTDETSPYKIFASLPNSIGQGIHTIKTVAYDDVDNQSNDTVSVEVSENSPDETLSLIDPKQGQTIERVSENYTVVVSVKKPDNYSLIKVYVDPTGAEGKKLIGQQQNPSSVFLTFDWALPESGSFAIFAEGITKTGEQIQTAGALVTIKPAGDSSQTQSELFVPQENLELF
jgi:hypothetical protein